MDNNLALNITAPRLNADQVHALWNSNEFFHFALFVCCMFVRHAHEKFILFMLSTTDVI